jgi:parallel beta-helix repeat protein
MTDLVERSRIALGCSLVASLGAVAAGCGDGLPEGCDALVVAGSADDQTAVQEALVAVAANGSVCFEGTFSFTDELSISEDGITVRATEAGATFDFAAQEFGANGVRVQAVEGFTVEGLVVKNTPGDGIRVENSSNVTFRDVEVLWDGEPDETNGAYGVYPVGCDNVLIEGTTVVGARDAGIYVGQSTNIIVRNSVAHGNVAGIEIENSMNAEVYDNEAYDNTGGILVFDLPELPAGNGGMTHVHDNDVHDNNRGNFAERGSIVGSVPAGTGMMVLATDDIAVSANTIANNGSVGVAILSYDLAEVLTGIAADDPMYDPYPETIYIHDNTFTNNGASPATLLLAFGGTPPLEDILWDGIVDPMAMDTDGHLKLCIQNTGARFRNAGVTITPTGPSPMPTTDLAPHDCMHPTLPPVSNGL